MVESNKASTLQGPLPQKRTDVQPIVLLSAPFVPANLGHLVWEEAFPLLLGMAQLGAYSEHALVLRTHGCNETVDGAAEQVPRRCLVRCCDCSLV